MEHSAAYALLAMTLCVCIIPAFTGMVTPDGDKGEDEKGGKAPLAGDKFVKRISTHDKHRCTATTAVPAQHVRRFRRASRRLSRGGVGERVRLPLGA